jgi:hypothetical protein
VGYYPRELVNSGSISSTIQSAHNLVNECFYEKVIKVKADVAALLNFFSDVSIDVRG